MDFKPAIEYLKQNGLIMHDDLFVVGQEAPSVSAALLFGAIGAAVSSSNKGQFIFIVNKQRIAIAEVDKKTGLFKSIYANIPKANLRNLKVSSFLTKSIALKADDFSFKFNTAATFRGYKQKNNVNELITFLKNHYKKN